MSKRVLCMFLAILAVFALGFSAVAEDAPQKDFKAVELQWWNLGSEQPDVDRINAAANEYLASIGKPYTVKLTLPGWGDFDTRASTALTTGQSVDLLFTCNWAANYLQYAPMGYFTDLTPYLAEYPQIVEILSQDFLDASKINGVNFALPTNKEKARSQGFLLNKALVDKYEIDITTIKTLEDLEPWFEVIKENEPGVWAVQPEKVPDFMLWDEVIGQYCFTGEEGDLEIVVADMHELRLEGIRKHSEWYQKGYMNPDINANTNTSAEMSTGKYFAWGAQLKPGKDAESSTPEVQWVQVDLGEVQIANTETTGAMHGIPDASKNKDEAFDFLYLLYTDEFLVNLFNFGQEGVDYNFVSDGVIEFVEGSGYNFNSGWTFGNQFLNYITTYDDPQKWEKLEAFNEQGRPLDSLGFIPDTESIQTELAAMAGIGDKYGDLRRGFSKDVEGDIAKMIADYEAIGYQDALTVLQEQFDAWYAEYGKK